MRLLSPPHRRCLAPDTRVLTVVLSVSIGRAPCTGRGCGAGVSVVGMNSISPALRALRRVSVADAIRTRPHDPSRKRERRSEAARGGRGGGARAAARARGLVRIVRDGHVVTRGGLIEFIPTSVTPRCTTANHADRAPALGVRSHHARRGPRALALALVYRGKALYPALKLRTPMRKTHMTHTH